MPKVSGRVSHYNPGNRGVPGIKIEGVGWRNAPEGSGILSADLEGQEVEVTLEPLNENGDLFITEVKTQRDGVRRLPFRFALPNRGVESKASIFVDEWFVFYQHLCLKLVPKVDGKEHYVIREMEAVAAKQATELWKQYRLEKQNFLEQVKKQ